MTNAKSLCNEQKKEEIMVKRTWNLNKKKGIASFWAQGAVMVIIVDIWKDQTSSLMLIQCYILSMEITK